MKHRWIYPNDAINNMFFCGPEGYLILRVWSHQHCMYRTTDFDGNSISEGLAELDLKRAMNYSPWFLGQIFFLSSDFSL